MFFCIYLYTERYLIDIERLSLPNNLTKKPDGLIFNHQRILPAAALFGLGSFVFIFDIPYFKTGSKI